MALERGLIVPRDGRTIASCSTRRRVRIVTRAAVRRSGRSDTRVERVAFVNVPSFVLHAGRAGAARGTRAARRRGVRRRVLRDRRQRVGRPAAWRPSPRRARARAGMAIKHAVEAAVRVVHPLEPGLHGIYGTIFTGPPSTDDARPAQRHDLRRRRSRSLAVRHRDVRVMAVLAAMGLLGPEQTFIHESIIGTRFRGRVAWDDDGRRTAGDRARDRGRGVDYRRARFPDRRGRPAAPRLPALVACPRHL